MLLHHLTGRDLVWPDQPPWKHGPLEAVRSGDTLEIFRNYLEEIELRTAGAVLMLPLFADLPRPSPPEGRWPPVRKLLSAWAGLRHAAATARLRRRLYERGQLGDLLMVFDRIISDSGCFTPGVAFGVYRKRRTRGANQEEQGG